MFHAIKPRIMKFSWNLFKIQNQGYIVFVSHCLPQPHSQVLPFPQVLFGSEEGYYGNQDSNAESDGGAVDPDVSQHAAVLPDQEEDLQIQVHTQGSVVDVAEKTLIYLLYLKRYWSKKNT